MSARWQHAAQLARSTGFGATGIAVDAIVRDGTDQFVANILAADPEADPGAKATPMPVLPIPASPEHPVRPGSAAQRHRNSFRLEQAQQLTNWWLRRMVTVAEPFGEKLTFCWHNHFATSERKVRSPANMAAQNATLRRLGRGNFRELGYAMLTDAALLKWLDGQENSAQSPNENLSREFMELFALGHDDGYTEDDVRAGACALTGWRLDKQNGGVSYVPSRHDTRVVTFLGHRGNVDTDGYLDAVLEVPGGPNYLATRWWTQLASDQPPPAPLVDRAVAAYGTDRDLSQMFATLLLSPEFAAARGTRVITPIEWVIGAARSLRVPFTSDAELRAVTAVLRQLGQVPFLPPSVGGWPSGRVWLSTAAAEIRTALAQRFAASADLSALDGSAPSRLDAVAYLLGIGAWSARSAQVLHTVASDPVQLVAVALNTPEYLVN